MSNSIRFRSRPSESSLPGRRSNEQQNDLPPKLSTPSNPTTLQHERPYLPAHYSSGPSNQVLDQQQNTSSVPIRPRGPPPPPPPSLGPNPRLVPLGREDRTYEDGDLVYYIIADDHNEDDIYPRRRYSTESEERYSQHSGSDYLSEDAEFENPSSSSVASKHDDVFDINKFWATPLDEHKTQLEYEDPNLCIDLNQRFAAAGNAPAWYIAHPAVLQRGDPAYLCPTCRHIDFNRIFTSDLEERLESVPEEYILLGFLPEIIQKLDCGFCSLISAVIKQNCRINEILAAGEIKEFDHTKSKLWQECLERRYFLTPFKYPTHYPLGFELFLRSDDDLAKVSQGDHTRALHSMGLRLIRDGIRGGRLVPSDQIDIELVKRRLKLCEYNSSLPPKQFQHTLRVIDVENLQIVDLEPRGRYLVLSYVWGGAKQVRLTKATIQQFRQPMGLQASFSDIPQTIKDAIEFVFKLNEKYLWVDSLCIIQDDEKDMLAQISQMGDVYGGGILTISAASGKTAHDGIPGVRPGSRKKWQITRQVGNLTLSNMLGLGEDDDTSPLAGRGWTYQEKVLTQRNLTINYDSIWWQCAHIASPEDEHCWHPQEGQRRRDYGVMFFFAGENERAQQRLESGLRNNFDTYAFMVSEYTIRQFTKQSDIGNAFTGVSRTLAGIFCAQMIFGMPETELDSALLWSPTGKSIRRHEIAPDGLRFPSWSWQGWEGHAAYPWAVEREYSISNQDSPLLFKSATLGSFWFGIDVYRAGGCVLDLEEWTLLETRWSNWEDSTGRSFFHPIHKYRSFEYKILAQGSSRLVLSTLSTHFNVGSVVIPRKINYNVNHKVFRLPVLDERNNMAGYIDIPDPELQPSGISQFVGRHEFIVLSRASITGHIPEIGPEVGRARKERKDILYGIGGTRNFVDEKGLFDIHTYHPDIPWCLYNVMMIKRVNGIAYRLAIGRIHVEAVAQSGPILVVVNLE